MTRLRLTSSTRHCDASRTSSSRAAAAVATDAPIPTDPDDWSPTSWSRPHARYSPNARCSTPPWHRCAVLAHPAAEGSPAQHQLIARRERLLHRRSQRPVSIARARHQAERQTSVTETAELGRAVRPPCFGCAASICADRARPCLARNASIRRAGSAAAEHDGTQSRAITKPGLSAAPP
jgi:hypothetical protein